MAPFWRGHHQQHNKLVANLCFLFHRLKDLSLHERDSVPPMLPPKRSSAAFNHVSCVATALHERVHAKKLLFVELALFNVALLASWSSFNPAAAAAVVTCFEAFSETLITSTAARKHKLNVVVLQQQQIAVDRNSIWSLKPYMKRRVCDYIWSSSSSSSSSNNRATVLTTTTLEWACSPNSCCFWVWRHHRVTAVDVVVILSRVRQLLHVN